MKTKIKTNWVRLLGLENKNALIYLSKYNCYDAGDAIEKFGLSVMDYLWENDYVDLSQSNPYTEDEYYYLNDNGRKIIDLLNEKES